MIGHNNPPPDEPEVRPGDWIALSRKVREHPIVGLGNPVKPDDPRRGAHSRFEAWFDLLCLAQYKAARVNNRGKVVTLDVGQLMGARSFLAARWNWTEKTVRGYLETLRAEGMISTSQGQQRASTDRNRANVITICNYSRYQMMSDAIDAYINDLKGPARGQQGASKRASAGQEKGQQLALDYPENSGGYGNDDGAEGQQRASTRADDLAEKGHNLTSNNKLNTPLPPKGGERSLEECFDEFWEVFPGSAPPRGRKTDRPKAFAAFQRIVLGKHRQKLKATAEEILAGARLYAASNPDPEFIPMPTTWLNGGRWADKPEAAESQQSGEKMPTPYWWEGREDRARNLPFEAWRRAIARFANGRWAVEFLSHPPGDERCLVPQELIDELNLLERYGPDGRARHGH